MLCRLREAAFRNTTTWRGKSGLSIGENVNAVAARASHIAVRAEVLINVGGRKVAAVQVEAELIRVAYMRRNHLVNRVIRLNRAVKPAVAAANPAASLKHPSGFRAKDVGVSPVVNYVSTERTQSEIAVQNDIPRRVGEVDQLHIGEAQKGWILAEREGDVSVGEVRDEIHRIRLLNIGDRLTGQIQDRPYRRG